jgi:phosphoserine phosphatase RsbU/P
VLLLLSDGIFEYHDVQQRQFGEERVERIVAEHHGRRMAELSAILFDAIHDFAQGAPQEDDMTIVLVKREAAP